VAVVPGRAVDGAGDVDHQRAHEPVVGALLRGAQARARPRQQLAARERAVQVVVGAGGQRGVGHPALRGDGQQPRLVEARLPAQRLAHARDLVPADLAIDDDEIGRRLGHRHDGRGRVGHRAGGLARRPQPRLDLALGGANHEHVGLPPAHGSGIGHDTDYPCRAARCGYAPS
jgi:hypothetical protein